ncbi:hypothetical protein PC41400_21625 [Paenibacillus chitinolyticus]|uniref:Uncharacterized protein n=1 Tax=Paenibacillus chitinolyticus TaxID=79263 RepID=A0A410X0Y7_9BACL|nr:hypothetical protein [Paenibacillus chitinolyticus]MCY9593730.1 hypothetical protein [Paenibacillus chitinolyticus]MCY9599704.1 hypothetical protein [Paenibacillus chitinolyticus]QAV20122.1 hypothetical protein PC41400_21625 [Paenibacillus chitinolyticus]
MRRFRVTVVPDVVKKLGRQQAENDAEVYLKENIREAGEDENKYAIKCHIDVRTQQLICNATKVN